MIRINELYSNKDGWDPCVSAIRLLNLKEDGACLRNNKSIPLL